MIPCGGVRNRAAAGSAVIHCSLQWTHSPAKGPNGSLTDWRLSGFQPEPQRFSAFATHCYSAEE
jgi:hypothetical protein